MQYPQGPGEAVAEPSQHSLLYLRFLNLVQAVRQIPTFPSLDSVEEQMLNFFAPLWHASQPVSVVEAMHQLPDVSASTVHRRLKTLQKKGMIAINPYERDNRVKHIQPTDLALRYLAALGECVERAQPATR